MSIVLHRPKKGEKIGVYYIMNIFPGKLHIEERPWKKHLQNFVSASFSLVGPEGVPYWHRVNEPSTY